LSEVPIPASVKDGVCLSARELHHAFAVAHHHLSDCRGLLGYRVEHVKRMAGAGLGWIDY
jgi:hypothetical protein